jgi:hypothetical protein
MPEPYHAESLDELRRAAILSSFQSIERFGFNADAIIVGYTVSNVVNVIVATSPDTGRFSHQQTRAISVQNVLRQSALANAEIDRKSLFEEAMPDELLFPHI